MKGNDQYAYNDQVVKKFEFNVNPEEKDNRQSQAIRFLNQEKYPFARNSVSPKIKNQKSQEPPVGMSQSSIYPQRKTPQKISNPKQPICSPLVKSLLNQCKYLEELVQKSRNIIKEKDEKLKVLIELVHQKNVQLKDFQFQIAQLKDERHQLSNHIIYLENRLNYEEDDEDQGSNEGSYQPRVANLNDLHHFLGQIEIQDGQMPFQDQLDIDNMTYEQLLQLEDHIGYVNKGLSEEQITKIPSKVYSELLNDNEELTQENQLCTICQFDYQSEQKCRILPCQHFYHSKCIKTWLLKDKCCPICKKEIVINQDQE